jgi:hypothetical protein
MSEIGQTPPPDQLQFQRAEVLPAENTAGPRCLACKQATGSTYYHAQGQVVCPLCAERIKTGQQAPPAISFARAMLYGAGAALAGCILYAAVAIITGMEIGLIAIVVGVMVGKAIRHASNGLGGRPQQILAVLLTYFAITTSYIPVIIYHGINAPAGATAGSQTNNPNRSNSANNADEQGRPQKRMGFGAAVLFLLLIAAAAPFLSLGSGVSGLIGLFIIFIGLRQAWKLTGRSEILIMGPYDVAPLA